MDHEHREDVRQLLLPYALGQLAPPERIRVEVALDGDDSLRRELEEIECVGARIVEGVPRVAAPAALKGRVLDAVRSGSERPVTKPVTSRAARQHRSGFTPALLAGGSLVAACLVLALVAFNLSRDLDSERGRAERLEQRADRGSTLPDGFEGVSTRTVSTKGGLEAAHGSLVRISDDQWILLLRDVPSPGLGNSWQVWTVDSNGLVENVAQWVKGDDSRVIVLDRPDVRQVMVSLEPSTRPAPVPTGEPVADVKV